MVTLPESSVDVRLPNAGAIRRDVLRTGHLFFQLLISKELCDQKNDLAAMRIGLLPWNQKQLAFEVLLIRPFFQLDSIDRMVNPVTGIRCGKIESAGIGHQ